MVREATTPFSPRSQSEQDVNSPSQLGENWGTLFMSRSGKSPVHWQSIGHTRRPQKRNKPRTSNPAPTTVMRPIPWRPFACEQLLSTKS
jgi:hypothetical protein